MKNNVKLAFFLTLIIAVICGAFMVNAGNAWASGSVGNVVIETFKNYSDTTQVDPKTLKPGDTFWAKVTVYEAVYLRGVDIYLEFDPDVLQVSSAIVGSINECIPAGYNPASDLSAVSNSEGWVKFVASNTTVADSYAKDALLSVEFQVKEMPPCPGYVRWDRAVGYNMAIDKDNNPIPISVETIFVPQASLNELTVGGAVPTLRVGASDFDLSTLNQYLAGVDQFGCSFNLDGKSVTWQTDDNDNNGVATVDSDGHTLKAVGPGETTVTATVDGVTSGNALDVTVLPESLNPEADVLTPERDAANVDITAAVTAKFNVDIVVNNLHNVTITYQSDGETWYVENVSATLGTDNRTVTIAHNDFDFNTQYTVVIPSDSVYDAYRQTYNEEVSWSFTTMESDAVHFNDVNLEDKVRSALGIPWGTYLRVNDMKGLESLYAGDSSISDLTGLEYADNLKDLDLSGNAISDIGALSGLTNNLQALDLGDNNISDIGALSDLTMLEYLKLNGNTISDINALSGLIRLEYLNLSDNRLNNITALLSNAGLGSEDVLNLFYNYLDIQDGSQTMADINTLIGRGVNVYYEYQNSLARPQVESVIPENEASGVAVSGNAVAIFDIDVEAVDLSNITISEYWNPNNQVTGLIPSLGSDQRTLTVSYDGLANNTTYVVTIPANTVVSTAYNTNNELYQWTFTTISGGTITGEVIPQAAVYRGGIHVELYSSAVAGGSTLVGCTYTDSEGTYTMTDVPAGTYKIKFSAEKYLDKVVADVVVTDGATATVSDVTMIVGDVSGDNQIDLTDVGYLATAYGSNSYEGNFDAKCDFNNDGQIELIDLGWMAMNYDSSGDQI